MKLFPFKAGNLYGLQNMYGVTVVDPQFSFARPSVENIAIVSVGDDSLVLLDTQNLQITQFPNWKEGSHRFQYGLLPISRVLDRSHLMGYMSRDHNLVIPMKFTLARDFDHLGATVEVNRTDGTYRRIDRQGNLTGEAFGEIAFFRPSGRYVGATIKRWKKGMVLIDGRGERVSTRTWEYIGQENDDLIPVSFGDNSYGWVTIEEKEVFSIEAKGIGSYFESGLIPVQNLDSKWGLMTVEGEWRLAANYDCLYPVGFNRFAAGNKDGEENAILQLIDSTGIVFGNNKCQEMHQFCEGFAKVYRTPLLKPGFDELSDWNFIDLNGNVISSNWYQ